MRRAAIALVLLLPLAACARPTEGPQTTVAIEQVSGTDGLDVVSARQTALDFVNAYASSPDDGGVALGALVIGPKLEAWAHWLGVQNREFGGTISANPSIASLDFVETLRSPDTDAVGARVDLGASIRFSYSPVGDQPFDRTRALDGPMALLRIGPGDWRVLDLLRDGQRMSDGIRLLRNITQSRDGVTVEVRSLFIFTPSWQFNVVVRNASGEAVRLDPNGVVLYTKQPGGYARDDGTATPSLMEVPPGASVEGIVVFPFQDVPKKRILALVYGRGGRALHFGISLSASVTGAPSPDPTT